MSPKPRARSSKRLGRSEPRDPISEPSIDSFETGALLVHVARRYFVPAPGSEKPEGLQDIADSLSRQYPRKFDASQVSRMISRARKLGVVRFSFDAHAAIAAEPVPGLSDDLMRAFKLRGKIEAVAILPPGKHKRARRKRFPAAARVEPQTPAHEQSAAPDIRVSDTECHYGLAKYAAEACRKDFKTGDVIAVAGGRAVYKFCEFVSRTQQELSDITVLPLSGRIWSGRMVGEQGVLTGDKTKLLQTVLDADDAARTLASSFIGENIAFRQIGLPLYASPGDAAAAMTGHCAALAGGQWRDRKTPSRAYVGVGILDPKTGHRIRIFHDEEHALNHGAKHPDKRLKSARPREPLERKAKTYLGRVGDHLSKAIARAESEHIPYPGDIANRLFTTLPTPLALRERSAGTHLQAYEDINRHVRAINAQSLVMEWGHLRQIPYCCVITGGISKLPALWTLLLPQLLIEHGLLPKTELQKPFISDVILDEPTGEALYECYTIFKNDTDMQERYAEMVSSLRLFADDTAEESAKS